jgi:hypothetical protein
MKARRVSGRVGSNIKEEVWVLTEMVVAGVDMVTVVRSPSIKQLVQNAKKNAKYLLSRAVTVRFIARIAFQNAKIAAANLTATVAFLH